MNKNSFALLPPKGWNSYDYFDTTVTESDVKANADFMAEHLLKYGYEYVVVDIQWYAYDAGSQRKRYQYIPFGKCEMDEYGRLLPCPQRFPSSKDGMGFKPLADYIHGKGLKFGIHIMRGIPRAAAHAHLPVRGSGITADMIADPASICGWNPDMYGLRDLPESQEYYDSLFELYASWGVDFVKCDDICNTNVYVDKPFMGKHEIKMIHRAIEKCGRDIVLSLSPGPALIEQAAYYCRYANMWRISDDFWDSWTLLRKMFDYCEQWQYVVSEGCWPDCDMLPVGKIGKGFQNERWTNFTREEQKTMITLWCLFKSPMMIGADLPQLDDWTLGLLTNHVLLAWQASDYRARQVVKDQHHAVWLTDSEETGKLAVAIFNFKDEETEITTYVEDWFTVSRVASEGSDMKAVELFSARPIAIKGGECRVRVPAHGVAVITLAASDQEL